MSKCVVFDFDGVIINSYALQKNALQESYRQIVGNGDPPYREFFKNSGDSLVNIFCKLGLPKEMLSLYIDISASNLQMITVHHGMKQVLQELLETGYQIALCTGKERERTLAILRYLDLQHYFKAIVCSDDVRNPKPSPDSLLKCMKLMQGKAEDTIMIGDGINDITCARSAGVGSIGVTWGDTQPEDVAGAAPDAIVSSAEELLETIKKRMAFQPKVRKIV